MKRYIKPNTSIHAIVTQSIMNLSNVTNGSTTELINKSATSGAAGLGKSRDSFDEGIPEDQNGWSDGLW